MKIYEYKGKKNLCGEKVRQHRVIEKMSQSDLAARMQIKGVMMERDTVSRIEHGARFVTDYELKIFTEVFGVDVDTLLE